MMELSTIEQMKQLRILHHDSAMVAVHKPAGMHVHPPEDPRHRIADSQNCMKLLRNQLGALVYPVHRLDRATSGVLLFALHSEGASHLAKQFAERTVKKTYVAVVRGFTAEHLLIDRELKNAGPAQTEVERIGVQEFPWENERFKTSRYSLIFASPFTGRMHQIRRHLAGQGYPLVGDTVYGDGEHNKLFRQHFDSHQLWLHAYQLSFRHPVTEEPITLQSRFPSAWHRLFDAFGVCPWKKVSKQSEVR